MDNLKFIKEAMAFNDDLNDMLAKGNKPLKGKVSNRNVEKLNASLNEELAVDELLLETLDKNKSLKYHYKKHVLKSGEDRKSYNRNKYDYMSMQEYYNYAKSIANKIPNYTIDTSIEDKDEIERIIDDYTNSVNGVLKVDYDLKNNSNGKEMFAIFNKNSKYSNYQEMCLVDKASGEPITIHVLLGGNFNKLINDFLA